MLDVFSGVEIQNLFALSRAGIDCAQVLAAFHRSEEHTSELQSQSNLVCRLLLEKKNNTALLPPHDTDDTRSPAVNWLALEPAVQHLSPRLSSARHAGLPRTAACIPCTWPCVARL